MLGLAEKFGKPGEASALRSFFQKAGNAGINAVAAEMASCPLHNTADRGQRARTDRKTKKRPATRVAGRFVFP